MTASLVDKIRNRFLKRGRGCCCTTSDFTDLGNYDAVRKALSRLSMIGFIERISYGLYHYPRQHDKLGNLPPSIDSIINAIQSKEKIKCQPSGAYAANLLGLSDQVPSKIIVLTDGPSKKIIVGNKEILFKKTVPKNMVTAGTITGLIIQAIKFLGKDHLSSTHFAQIKRLLNPDDIKHLRRHYLNAPAWIAKIIKNNLLGENNG